MKESGEMYLETILVLSRQNPQLHAIEVAQSMGFSKPSVSRALAKLREEGFIEIDGDSHIALTEEGSRIAETIYERHTVLSGMLSALGVSEETARQDACRIEHVISDESFEAIKNHISKGRDRGQ